MPLAAWCTRCHAPSPGDECARCGEQATHLEVHPGAPGTAPRVFEALKGWQRRQARVQGTEPFLVLPNRALACLAAVQPETPEALEAVPGIGPKKARDYGAVLLRYFRALHARKDEQPLVARAPMPEGLSEEERALVVELREASRPLAEVAAERGFALEEFLARIGALVEKGCVDLPHVYCSPAEVAWLLPRLEATQAATADEVARLAPESSLPARYLLPALARWRAKRGPGPQEP